MPPPSGFTAGQPLSIGVTQQRRFVGKAPSAGSSFSLTFGALFTHRLIGCVFTVSTDANAANRLVTVEYLEQDTIPFNLGGAGLVLTANTTAQRFCGSMYRGVAEWAANTDVSFPLCPIWMHPASTVTINITGIQTGDTITNIVFVTDAIPQSEAQRVALAEQVT